MSIPASKAVPPAQQPPNASLPGGSRSEELTAAWREFFARAARERPAHPAARDFMRATRLGSQSGTPSKRAA